MRSIGEMARDSGLSVSALRFYDRAGVLVPAWVDPVSGYRWYGPEQLEESRLLARLRRAGMPLADIRLVLAGWSSADTDLVRRLLQAHLRRLEPGLSDARGEFSTLRALLERREKPMTSPRTADRPFGCRPRPELAAALDAVRFAASTDPELPMLGGVLFDIEGETLHVVATDRYRMAVAHAGTTGPAGPARRSSCPPRSPTRCGHCSAVRNPSNSPWTATGVTLGDRGPAGGGPMPRPRLPRLPPPRPPAGGTPRPRRRAGLPGGGGDRSRPHQRGTRAGRQVLLDLSVLKVAADGTVALCEDGDDDQDQVAVNREFLLHALAAGARDRLILEFGAPTAPMAIRRPDDEDTLSMLMPVRLDN